MRNLLYIIKHDRQAAMLLLVVFLALGVFTLEFFTEDKTNKEQRTKTETRHHTAEKEYYAVPAKEIHLQPFDPNTADSTVLLGLGLQPWQVRSIYKYRANGGVYSRPEDFARLYGLSLKKYKELRPYIRIAKDYRPAAESVGQTNHFPKKDDIRVSGVAQQDISSSMRPMKLKAGQTLSVNASDTTELQRVPGIGPYYARKIVRLRDRLGGIVSKEQLLEIEGFPESALPYFTISGSNIRKLNINKATAEQLRSHPYITYIMAREITNYRRMHGTIQNIDDLSLLPDFTKETRNKLRPYLEY